ncbi:MAG TPA: hypothetical protein DCL35_00250 [Candidatus Omnitrophica bacterium]|nr:hypothetical protein [Candidatus Omnitrophota bacterium]
MIMEPSRDGSFGLKKHAEKAHHTSKLRKIDPEVSTRKLIIFFFLAIIPALLLGYLIIYGAYELASKQKKPQKLYQYYQKDKQDYWQYQEKTRQVILKEEGRKKNLWGSLHKMDQDMEAQKEAMRLQQEQLAAEQQRIHMLLQEFKK